MSTGPNGKTTLLDVLQRLMGSSAVLSESLERFQKDNFAMSSLVGKRLLVDEDVAQDLVLNDGLIKKLSEAKLAMARAPYGRRKKAFTCSVLPVMAGNHHPLTGDISHGMRRRTYVIPFNRTFDKSEQVLGLIDNLWKEQSGILNVALAGYQRLAVRGMKFDEPKECDDARQRFFEESHPLRDFIKHRCAQDKSNKLRVSMFRNAMLDYLAELGISTKLAGNRLSPISKPSATRLPASRAFLGCTVFGCCRPMSENPFHGHITQIPE